MAGLTWICQGICPGAVDVRRDGTPFPERTLNHAIVKEEKIIRSMDRGITLQSPEKTTIAGLKDDLVHFKSIIHSIPGRFYHSV